MFTLQISTDNSAFSDSLDPDYYPDAFRAAEIARILVEIAEGLGAAGSSGSAFDINGNDVGEWVITS